MQDNNQFWLDFGEFGKLFLNYMEITVTKSLWRGISVSSQKQKWIQTKYFRSEGPVPRAVAGLLQPSELILYWRLKDRT